MVAFRRSRASTLAIYAYMLALSVIVSGVHASGGPFGFLGKTLNAIWRGGRGSSPDRKPGHTIAGDSGTNRPSTSSSINNSVNEDSPSSRFNMKRLRSVMEETNAYSQKGEHAKASELLENLYSAAMGDPETKRNGQILFGQLSGRMAHEAGLQGQWIKSEAYLRRGIAFFDTALMNSRIPRPEAAMLNDFRISMWEDVARCLNEQGKYALAEKEWRNSLKKRASLHSEECNARGNPDLTKCREGLATAVAMQGRFTEAEQLSKEALKWHIDNLQGCDPKDAASTKAHDVTLYMSCMVQLVNFCMATAKFEEAQEYLMTLIEILDGRTSNGFHDLRHFSNSDFLISLGICLHERGLHEEARQAQWRALNNIDNTENRVSLPVLLSAISLCQQHGGTDPENDKLLENLLGASIERERGRLGGQKHRLASVLTCAATARLGWGRVAEAEKLLLEALNMKGENDPSRAEILSKLGIVIATGQRFQEAEPYLRSALAIYTNSDVLNRPAAANTMLVLAQSLLAMNRVDEAESVLQEAKALLESMYGNDSSALSVCMYFMATTRMMQGKPSEAEDLLRRALSLPSMTGNQGGGIWKVPGGGVRKSLTSFTANCRLSLGGILLHQGKSDEALSILSDTVSMLPQADPLIPAALTALANALLRLGREQEAENLATRVLELRTTEDGSMQDCPEAISNLVILSRLNLMRGSSDAEHGEDLAHIALSMSERVYGAESQHSVRILEMLAEFLSTEPGRGNEADALTRRAATIVDNLNKKGGDMNNNMNKQSQDTKEDSDSDEDL